MEPIWGALIIAWLLWIASGARKAHELSQDPEAAIRGVAEAVKEPIFAAGCLYVIVCAIAMAFLFVVFLGMLAEKYL